MKSSRWADFVEPDLSHAEWDYGLDRPNRSIIPDPLAVLIAAEGGKPILAPLFPINGITPQSPCPHHGPIAKGSVQCCMICHASGLDAHPVMARDPASDPKPEPAEPTHYEGRPDQPAELTRKQRRRLQFQGTDDARPDHARPAQCA